MRSLLLVLALAGAQEEKPGLTLAFENSKLSEVFAEITKASGIGFEIDPRVADERVTLKFEGCSPLAAAEAVCRAHGKIHLEYATYARRVHVRPGDPGHAPMRGEGEFIFKLSRIIDVRTQTFEAAPARGLTLQLLTAWSGCPSALGRLEITEAVDDTGLSLLKDEKKEAIYTTPKSSLADLTTVALLHPKEGARKIFLKGRREVLVAGESRPIHLAVEKLPATDGPLALTAFASAPGGATAVFEFARDDQRIIPGPDRFRDLAFIDKEGKRYQAEVTTAAAGPEKVRFEVMIKSVPRNAILEGCEATFIVKYTGRTLTFEFKDVELP